MKQFNWLLFLLTSIYILIIGSLIAFAIGLIVFPFSPRIATYAPVIPILLLGASATAFTWSTELTLMKLNVRQSLREEEYRLTSAMKALQIRAAKSQYYRLLLIETTDLDAFDIGHHTMAISFGMLCELTHTELEAVMAHEMAHLQSGDAILLSARQLTSKISHALYVFSHQVWRILRPLLLVWFIASQILLMIIYVLSGFNAWLILAGIGFLMMVLPHCNRLFHFLFLAESRYTEYRRDAYAHKLGYGLALSSVLRKLLATTGTQITNRHHIYFHSTHPILHHRIRKLERQITS